MTTVLVRWALLTALGAQPPTYGGEIVSYVYGDDVTAEPSRTRTAADAAAHAAVYEGLYAESDEGLRPVLARDLPRTDGSRVVVPLRREVLMHDGRPLSPRRVIEALARIADSPSGAYVLAPIRRRRGRLAITPDDGGFALEIELRYPDPDFAFLLASDHARLAWPVPPGLTVGTGPFRWIRPRELGPFLGYRDGRPFLDRIVWRPYASRFGAGSLADQGQVPVFGVPKPTRAVEGAGSWLVLQVGSRAGGDAKRERIRRHVSRALRRDRILRRYHGPHDQPAAGFIVDPLTDPKSKVEGIEKLELLAPQSLRFGYRLLERIQLDLFRSGLPAEIRWVEPAVFDDLSRRGQFGLRVLEVRPGMRDDETSRATLHRIMSVAAALGRLSVIETADLALFAGADAQTRRTILRKIERDVRRASGTVVIGRLAPAVAYPSRWSGFADWANLSIEARP